MNAHRHSVRAALLVVGSNRGRSRDQRVHRGAIGADGEERAGPERFTPCAYCRFTFPPEITAETTTPSNAPDLNQQSRLLR